MRINVDTVSERCSMCPELEIETESFYSADEVISRRFYCTHLNVCRNIDSFKNKEIERDRG